jgi:hypothetical protein
MKPWMVASSNRKLFDRPTGLVDYCASDTPLEHIFALTRTDGFFQELGREQDFGNNYRAKLPDNGDHTPYGRSLFPRLSKMLPKLVVDFLFYEEAKSLQKSEQYYIQAHGSKR